MKRLLAVTGSLLFLLASCSDADLSTSAMSAGELEDYKSSVFNSEEYSEYAEGLQWLEAAEEEELAALRAMEGMSDQSVNDEPFVFFVIGDSELNMRGNTYDQLENWIQHINDVESFGLEFPGGDFEEGESRQITKPALVFLAGDINKDRTFGISLPGDLNNVTNQDTRRLFNQLDDDILFFAGNGNHDWDPYQWNETTYGHNFGGLFSNLGTAQFVRSTYLQGLNATDEISENSFNYDRNVSWFQPTTSAEFNYSFEFRGIRFTQLNQFLFQPAAMVSFESIFSTGPAWYFPTRSAQWFQGLCDASALEMMPHVVVQHFPINTGDGWWNDDLGGTPDGLRKQYMDIFEDSYEPVMFSGHNHFNRTTKVEPYGIFDHTCGYFANGYLTAVKASATRGIYAIAYVNLSDLTTTDGQLFNNYYNLP